MADIVYSNIRELMYELNQIEPTLKKAMVKDLKEIAKPIQSAIVSNIPSAAPMRGMINNGRLSWANSVNYKGQRVPAKSVSVRFRASYSRKTAITSLLSVVVNSPAVAMLDMARTAKTRQGAVMIRRVGGKASRFVWPAAERMLPATEAKVRIVLDRAAEIVNRRFN